MNSTRLALFTLAVGLVAGIGAGFLLGSKPQSTVSAATASVDRTGAIDRDAVDRALGETNDLAPVSAHAAPSAAMASSSTMYDGAARSASKAALGRVAAELSGSDRSSWTGTITGTVLDHDGNLLSGVTIITANGESRFGSRVRAKSSSDVGRAYSGPEEINAVLDERAKALLKSRSERLTATTDAAGQFAFSDLRPGRHSFTAYHEGLVFRSQSAHTGESVRFIGRSVALFHLDIRLPDGTAPEEAVLLVDGSQYRRATTYRWSPDEPVLRLKERAATLTVLAGDVISAGGRYGYSSDYHAEGHTVDLDRDGEGPHVIEVESRRLLRVTLKDVSGLEPRLKAWVKVVKSESAEGGDLATMFDGARSLRRGDGVAYTIADLDAGVYVIGAGRGKGPVEVSTRIELSEGLLEAQLVLGELDMGRFLTVRCSGPGGKPLADVSFQRRVTWGEGSASGGITAISRGPGTFWLTHAEITNGNDWADVTQAELTADARGYGKITSELSNGQESLALEFQSSCELIVHVSGDVSQGFSISAAVVMEDQNGGRRRFSNPRDRKRVNGEGEARLTGLQPGLVRVTLHKTSSRNRRRRAESLASQEITVRPGNNSLTIVAPTFHDVVIYAPDFEKGNSFLLEGANRDGQTYLGRQDARLDANLRATFENVVAGEYTLRTWENGRDSQVSVTVPTGEVLFQPEIINAYRIVRLKADKLGAKGGLLKGDIVVAINGKEFEGRDFYQRLKLDLKDGAVSLSVNRGGRALTISIEPAEEKTDPWTELGVSWEPMTQ